MKGFKITTSYHQEIIFKYYLDTAPVRCKAFEGILPFTKTFYHARVSGKKFESTILHLLTLFKKMLPFLPNLLRLFRISLSRQEPKQPIVLVFIMAKEKD